ncbi:hypothetical protein D3C79_660430 [compost metagenome]
MAPPAIAGQRRAWVIQRQFQRRMLLAQLRAPVVQLPLLFPGLQPAALPQGVVTVLDRQRTQLRLTPLLMGDVQAAEFLDQHIHRPAIRDDVVQGQQQHMLVVGQAQQMNAQQRPGRQIERLQRLLFGQRAHALLAFGNRQGAQVVVLDLRPVRRRRLLKAIVGVLNEHRTQGFMTLHQAGKGPLQRPDIQRALQAYGAGQVIGTTVRLKLPQHPHALLGIGQPRALGHIDLIGNRELGEVDPFTGQALEKDAALFQRQLYESAGKLAGIFGIHRLSSIQGNNEPAGPVVKEKRMNANEN